MNPTGIPYLDLTYNPGGAGCSRGCPKCWARNAALRIGRNIGCRKCETFAVHLHDERLGRPAASTGELFDPRRPIDDVRRILESIRAAPQHTFILLTQQPHLMLRDEYRFRPEWFCGITARHQRQLDAGMRNLLQVRCRRWLSAEPLEGPMDLRPWLRFLDGVIVGANDNADEPEARPAWIASIARQCEAASVPVYVKQIRIDGRLATNSERFPEYLRIGELPWPCGGLPAGWDHHPGRRRSN